MRPNFSPVESCLWQESQAKQARWNTWQRRDVKTCQYSHEITHQVWILGFSYPVWCCDGVVTLGALVTIQTQIVHLAEDLVILEVTWGCAGWRRVERSVATGAAETVVVPALISNLNNISWDTIICYVMLDLLNDAWIYVSYLQKILIIDELSTSLACVINDSSFFFDF